MAPLLSLEACSARLRVRDVVAAMVSTALELVARACELFGLNLLAEPALLFEGLKPVIGESHDVAIHLNDAGLFEHGQIAPANVARPRTVQDFGQLLQSEGPAAGVEGVENGATNLAQSLDTLARLRQPCEFTPAMLVNCAAAWLPLRG